MFIHSILGGMERRFEIIDNQINHIPFTHDASDKHKEKCRNSRKLFFRIKRFFSSYYSKSKGLWGQNENYFLSYSVKTIHIF